GRNQHPPPDERRRGRETSLQGCRAAGPAGGCGLNPLQLQYRSITCHITQLRPRLKTMRPARPKITEITLTPLKNTAPRMKRLPPTSRNQNSRFRRDLVSLISIASRLCCCSRCRFCCNTTWTSFGSSAFATLFRAEGSW